MNTRKPFDPTETAVSAGLTDYLIRLQHVGHIVADIEAAIASYQRIYGLDESSIRRVPDQGENTLSRFAFLDVAGTEFELIEPVSEEFRLMLFKVPSGGGGINHLAWRIRDLDGALSRLAEDGIRPGFVTPNGPVSLPDKRMVYLDPATTEGVLVELLEYHSDVGR